MTEVLLTADFMLAGASDRHAGYARFRDGAPVRLVELPSGGTAWLVTGYDAVRQALAHPTLQGKTGVVGHRRALSADLHQGMNTHMLNLNPPDHTRLRKLVSAAFTSRRMQQMRPRIQEITDDILDRLEGRDQVDIIQDLALPLPIRLLTEMLGVPPQDAGAFHQWTTTLTASALSLDQLQDAGDQMLAYVRQLLARKRQNPGTDLLSAFVAVRDGDDRLSEHELTSMVFLFLIAGYETTVNLIGNSVLALTTNPDQLARLRAEPELIPAAVEEFLRFESPVQAALRYSTDELELAGVTIPAGAVVIVSLLAANRDPARFDHSDTLDLGRSSNPQVAFGHGIHHCLGAPLARLEGAIAISSLLARFPRLRLAVPVGSLNWRLSLVMHGLAELPVRLR